MQKMIKSKRHLVNEARAFINQTIKKICKDKSKRFGIKRLTYPKIKTMGPLKTLVNYEGLACLSIPTRGRNSILLSDVYMYCLNLNMRKWIYLHEISHHLVFLKTKIKKPKIAHGKLFKDIENILCDLHNIYLKRDHIKNDYPDKIYYGKKLIAKRSRGQLVQQGKLGKKLSRDAMLIKKECKSIVEKLEKKFG